MIIIGILSLIGIVILIVQAFAILGVLSLIATKDNL